MKTAEYYEDQSFVSWSDVSFLKASQLSLGGGVGSVRALPHVCGTEAAGGGGACVLCCPGAVLLSALLPFAK